MAGSVVETLLRLGERRHTGGVRLGDTVVELRDGRIVAVTDEGGETLGDFLVRTGRVEAAMLEEATRQAEQRKLSLDLVLQTRARLSSRILSEARRELFARKLAPALERVPEVTSTKPQVKGSGEDVARTVLAAIAIRIGPEEIASLEARRSRRVQTTSALRKNRNALVDALGPSALPPEGELTVGDLLERGAEAARGLAVIVEAGLASIEGGPPEAAQERTDAASAGRKSVPPPIPSDAPAKSERRSVPPPVPTGPPSQPPPPPEGAQEASVGRTPTIDLTPPDPPTPPADPTPRYDGPFESLDDPLDGIEAVLQTQSLDAPPAERVALLVQKGSVWEDRYGSIEEAAQSHREAAAADPTALEAITAARAACERLGDVQSAVAYLRLEVSLLQEPAARAAALTRLGRLLFRTGDRLGAAQTFGLALDVEPDGDAARAGLAEASEPNEAATLHADRARRHLAAGRSEEALAAIRRALVLDAASEAVVTVAEEVLEAAKRHSEHERVLRAAIAGADPERRVALFVRLGSLGERAGRVDLALEGYGMALAAAPDDEQAGQGYRRVLAAAGRHADLADWLEVEAGRLDVPRCVEVLREMAGVVTGPLSDPDRAATIWVRILELAPEDTEALEAVESHFTGRRDSAGLLDAYGRSTSSTNWTSTAALVERLAAQARLAEEKLGAVRRASAAWERVREIDPEFAGAEEAISRLAAKVKLQDGLRELAEKEVASTEPEKRLQALRKLAGLLKDDPADWSRSAELHRELLSLVPGDPAAILALGRLYDQMGDRAGTLWLLRHRLSHSEHRAEKLRALKKLGTLLAEQPEDLADSRDVWREVTALEPMNLDARRHLEKAAAHMDDPEELVRLLSERAEATQKSKATKEQAVEALAERARIELGRIGSPARAAASFSRLLEVAPEDPRGLWGSATAYEAAGDADSARAAASRLAGSAVGKDDDEALALLARTSRACGDLRGACDALQRIASLRPYDTAVALEWIDVADGADDPQSLEAAAEHVLESCTDPPTAREAVRRVSERLEGEGFVDAVRRLCLRYLDEGGSPDVELARRAARVAVTSQDPAGAAIALERALPGTEGKDRIETLREIAKCWLEAGDRAGAVRAHLRVLAVDPSDVDALESLEGAYAAAGNGHRLLAVLELRANAERARGAPAKTVRDVFMRMAAAARDLVRDPAECLGLLDCAIAESPGDQKVLTAIEATLFAQERHQDLAIHLERRAEGTPGPEGAFLCRRAALVRETMLSDLPGALRDLRGALDRDPTDAEALGAAERVAARSNDIASIRAIYRLVIERASGAHGARAAAYRGARFLEAVGRKEEALAEYGAVFASEPRTGAVLSSIERLCSELGDFRPVVHCWRRIAEAARDIGTRTAAYRRAAETAEEKLGDRAGAMELLLVSYAEFADPDVEASLRRLAREITDMEPESGPAVFERLLRAYEVRASRAFDGEEAARWLAKAAVVAEEDRGDTEAAFEFLARAVEAAPDAEVDLTPELERLATRCDLWPRVTEVHERIVTKTLDPAIAVKHLLALGRVEDEELDRPEAEDRYRRVLMMKKGSEDEAHARLERLLRRRGRWSELVALLEESIASLPAGGRSEALAEVARIWEENLENVREALSAWERLREESPEEEAPRQALLRLYARAGEHRRVASLLAEEAQRATDPSVVRALLLRRAKVLETDAGDPDEALGAYRAVLAIAPDDAEARDGAERTAEAAGRTSELTELLSERARTTGTAERFDLVEREVNVLVGAGRAAEGLTTARDYLAQVTEEGIDDQRIRKGARGLVVKAAMASGEPEAMAEAYELLLEAAPPGPERGIARRRRALILAGLAGREAEAIPELELAAEEAPDDVEGLLESAKLASRLGHEEATARFLTAAAERTTGPIDATRLLTRAAAHFRAAGNAETALAKLEAALERLPGDREALAAILDLSLAMGHVQAVEAYARRLVDGGPAEGPESVDRLVVASKAILESGNPARALEIALAARSKDPARADAAALEALARRRADLLGDADAWRKLEASLSPAAKEGDPDDLAVINLCLSDARLALGDPQGAMNVLRAAEKRIGASGILAVGLAERLVALGEHAAALPYFATALERPVLTGLREVARVRLAAGLAAVSAGDEGSATGYLLGAMAEDPSVTADARRALADLRIAQGDAARAAMELRRLADVQTGADRGVSLHELGQTLALALGDLTGAVKALEEAIQVLPAGSDEARGTAEDLLDLYGNVENWSAAAQLARKLVEAVEGPAKSRFHLAAAEALAALGQEDAAVAELRLAREADPANPRVAAELERALEGRGEVRQLLRDLQSRLREDLPRGERARVLIRIGELRQKGNNDLEGAAAAFDEALRLGDLDAGDRLAELQEGHPDRVFDALAVHRRILALDPGRISSLRALHRIYVGLGAGPEASAVASVLHLFDETLAPSDAPPRLEDLRSPPEGALEALRPDGLHALVEVFSLVWEGGFPLFRKDLPAFGVSAADRVSPLADTPLSRVYAAAIRVLGRSKTPMFLRLADGGEIEVALTYPPAVVAGTELRPETPEGRFLVGRAVEATASSLVLGFVLGRTKGRILFQAVGTAFGPAGVVAPEIAKEVADLAGDLWKTLPPRAQRRLQELCGRGPLPGEADEWMLLVRQATNRAGLLVSGDAAASLWVIAEDSPALEGVDVETERGFRDAVAKSREFADLVSFAVSDEYLSLRWRADTGRHR